MLITFTVKTPKNSRYKHTISFGWNVTGPSTTWFSDTDKIWKLSPDETLLLSGKHQYRSYQTSYINIKKETIDPTFFFCCLAHLRGQKFTFILSLRFIWFSYLVQSANFSAAFVSYSSYFVPKKQSAMSMLIGNCVHVYVMVLHNFISFVYLSQDVIQTYSFLCKTLYFAVLNQ